MDKKARSKYTKIADYVSIGGLGVAILFSFSACDDKRTYQSQSEQDALLQGASKNKQGAFVIIEEQKDGSYKVLEEYPSQETRVMLKDKNGKERMLSKDEIDQFLKLEEQAIDANTSKLIQEEGSGGGGLSLGGAILASAAGAILGSYIGSKLFNNPNFKQNAMRSYKSPQAYERSVNNFSNKSTSGTSTRAATGKSGFFGSNTPKTAPSTSTRPMGG